jgi:predicted  nucleic acid-binding Zn-ribbon protein
MSTLNGAEARLEAALSRLEQAVQSGSLRQPAPGEAVVARTDYDVLQRDVDSLKAECAQLREELRASDEAQTRLRQAGQELVSGLDRTIGAIDGMLES